MTNTRLLYFLENFFQKKSEKVTSVLRDQFFVIGKNEDSLLIVFIVDVGK